MAVTEQDSDIRDSTVYWFVTLEEARRRGLFRRAEQAQAELERLGIFIKFNRQPRREAQHASQ